MYSAHNEGKSAVPERFIGTLKNKVHKYMTSIPKNVYIDKVDDLVNKCNNTYHRTIKMKPVDVKSNTYINSNKKINDPKFKIGDIVRISKYKNIFAKLYVPNWSDKVFFITEAKNTFPMTYVISDLNCSNFIRKTIAKNKSKRA